MKRHEQEKFQPSETEENSYGINPAAVIRRMRHDFYLSNPEQYRNDRLERIAKRYELIRVSFVDLMTAISGGYTSRLPRSVINLHKSKPIDAEMTAYVIPLDETDEKYDSYRDAAGFKIDVHRSPLTNTWESMIEYRDKNPVISLEATPEWSINFTQSEIYPEKPYEKMNWSDIMKMEQLITGMEEKHAEIMTELIGAASDENLNFIMAEQVKKFYKDGSEHRKTVGMKLDSLMSGPLD